MKICLPHVYTVHYENGENVGEGRYSLEGLTEVSQGILNRK